MAATIQEISADTDELTVDDLINDLQKQGVVFGIDNAALNKVVAQYNQSGRLNGPIVAAKGKEPVGGSAATLRPRFASRQITIQEEDSSTQLEISELKTQGSLVAILEPLRPGQEGITVTSQTVSPIEHPQVELTVGANLKLEEQTGRILATVSGYPELLTTTKKKKSHLRIELTPAVTIDEDKMAARLSLRPPLPGYPVPDHDSTCTLLTEHGVIFGINAKALDDLITRLSANSPPEKEVAVAHGMLPVHGRDSHLRFALDIGPIPGKIQANGQIDFRERQLFVGVKEGQLIASRVPATPGEPGKNIHGETVVPIPGKELPVLVSNDACFDEQTGEVHAARSGVLSITGDNTIRVCAMQVIPGDVDYSTGNITTRDALQITGSVKPLFKVTAGGDVGIKGNIEAAVISSGANIILQGGATGKRAKLQADGDIDINFIEHGRAFANASIILRREAYYSRLQAGSDLHCDKNSRVIGGQLVAAGQISCGTIGSVNAPPGIVAAGVQPARLQQMFDLRRKIEKIETKLAILRSRGGNRGPSKKLTRLEKKLRKTANSLKNLDLAGTMIPEQQIKIIVHGTIYKGTEIRIGNRYMIVKKDSESVFFSLAEELDCILVHPL